MGRIGKLIKEKGKKDDRGREEQNMGRKKRRI